MARFRKLAVAPLAVAGLTGLASGAAVGTAKKVGEPNANKILAGRGTLAPAQPLGSVRGALSAGKQQFKSGLESF
jgi:hypothetical protein